MSTEDAKSTCFEGAGKTADGAERTQIKLHDNQATVVDSCLLFHLLSSNTCSLHRPARHVHLRTCMASTTSLTSIIVISHITTIIINITSPSLN